MPFPATETADAPRIPVAVSYSTTGSLEWSKRKTQSVVSCTSKCNTVAAIGYCNWCQLPACRARKRLLMASSLCDYLQGSTMHRRHNGHISALVGRVRASWPGCNGYRTMHEIQTSARRTGPRKPSPPRVSRCSQLTDASRWRVDSSGKVTRCESGQARNWQQLNLPVAATGIADSSQENGTRAMLNDESSLPVSADKHLPFGGRGDRQVNT